MTIFNKIKEKKYNSFYIFNIILSFIILISLYFTNYAYAASKNLEQIFIKQNIIGNQHIAQSTEIEYNLKSINYSPLPENFNKVYSFKIRGNAEKNIKPINFTRVGIYTYELEVSQNNKNINLDKTKYKIEVHIISKDSNLQKYIFVKNERGEKLTDIIFNHRLKETPNTPSGTGETKNETPRETEKETPDIPSSTDETKKEIPLKPDGKKTPPNASTGDKNIVPYILITSIALVVFITLNRSKYKNK